MKSPMPKYFLVKNILRSRLQREYVPGTRLPSELELCDSFSVSRATIQQALALLEKEGVIRREQGRGTFYLGEPAKRNEATRWSGLLESVMKYREGAFTRVLSKQITPATRRIAERLRLPPESPVLAVERVGVIDEEPIFYVVAYLPEGVGLKLLQDPEELNQNQAIVSILQDKYGVEIASVSQTIAATLADPVFAGHLQIELGSPVLEVERTYLDVERRGVNFSIAFYRTDRCRFDVAMKDWR